MQTDLPADHLDQFRHLRAYAAQARERTIARLRTAITAIEARGAAVTIATIKQESGLDYSAYYRNDAAYALYREHATHFTARATIAKAHRQRRAKARAASARVRQARDPLMAYSRRELVAKLRAAWTERDLARTERGDAVQQYQNLLREHLSSAQTIFTLQTQLAQYEEHRDYLRRTMQEREHHP